MTEAPEIFARIYERHGHRCPMSTLGGRLAMAALGLLADAEASGEDELRGYYFTRTCAVDGVAEVTGLTEADGGLEVCPDGRHALRLERGGVAVEVELTEKAMQMAGEYRRFCYEIEAGWDDLDEEERRVREIRRQAWLDTLLPRLWQAPDHELVRVVREDAGA
ncbi:MAG: hypothetical protein D6751_02135 [Deltaproteobacteria bacterium]|nr:MAG: hypothetical protein D6751_02135 [Deltaproteobacteria bacterium]